VNKTIDIQGALKFGWETLRNNFGFFLQTLVVLVVAAAIPAWLIGLVTAKAGTLLVLPLQLLNLVWQSLLGMGVLTVCLKFEDGKTPTLSDLWSSLDRALDYIVVKFVVGVIVMIGLILLIVPGLIWGLQFYLATYLVVDRRASVVDALKGSSAITRGAKWNLAGFAGAMFLLNLVGLLCLGVGVLITLPITMLASVHVYRKLLAATEL
jgi:uncharacterized membrane protein